MNRSKGFTLIELLVVISIIALLSSVVAASLSSARKKARDSNRIQNARQISTALELYEQSNNTYKIPTAGLDANPGTGYVSKGGETSGYTNSILSTLKSLGFYNASILKDPLYGTDNYYLGLCTSTNAYNVFIKVEQTDLQQSSTTISQACDGIAANSFGFNYVSATVGGNSGGLAEVAPGGGGEVFTCGVSTVTGLDSITYGTVVGEDTKCWLDRNLGATQVATSYNDALAYGHYYQWGRGTDGHQIHTSPSTATLSSSSTPGHGSFITTASSPYDWMTTRTDSLWQGVNGTNNPCPVGFRVPSQAEWQTWISTIPGLGTASCVGSSTCRDVAFNTNLKLTAGGTRSRADATRVNVGVEGTYRTTTIAGTNAYIFAYGAAFVVPGNSNNRANGFAVRCFKN